MKTMRPWGIVVVTLVSVWAVCAMAGAQPAEEREPGMMAQEPGMMPPGGDDMAAPPEFGPGAEAGESDFRINWQALGLTDEQRTQMRQQRRDFEISTASLREQLRFAQQDLREAMLADPVDRAKIDSLLETIARAKQQRGAAAVKNLLAIKALLTPEQLQQIAEWQPGRPGELRGVDLTPEQEAQIRKIQQTARQQNREQAEKLQDLKQQLRTALFAAEVDQAQITQVQDAIAAAETTLEKGRVDMLLAIKAVLTPEQVEQMKQHREDRRDLRQERRNRRTEGREQNMPRRNNRQQ